MNVTVETLGGATVVVAQGRLDFGASAEFQKTLESSIAAKPFAVIVDGAGLDYLSSAGLRAFLVAARSAREAGVAFCLCSLQSSVRDVLELSGFNRIIDVHADRAAALAKVGGTKA